MLDRLLLLFITRPNSNNNYKNFATYFKSNIELRITFCTNYLIPVILFILFHLIVLFDTNAGKAVDFTTNIIAKA
ncbi:hypothetical protein BpHYR1_045663 [Brachionus plicatilis]|uniref:Uncharacterized protein n=1 Tax=Brachionus plicatilis TaxID=10195 RepID=A0A3M7PED4_BRAPC|nr:hypothetical protein BpHYR1_045663 [Brachionus plicatilis]